MRITVHLGIIISVCMCVAIYVYYYTKFNVFSYSYTVRLNTLSYLSTKLINVYVCTHESMLLLMVTHNAII